VLVDFGDVFSSCDLQFYVTNSVFTVRDSRFGVHFYHVINIYCVINTYSTYSILLPTTLQASSMINERYMKLLICEQAINFDSTCFLLENVSTILFGLIGMF